MKALKIRGILISRKWYIDLQKCLECVNIFDISIFEKHGFQNSIIEKINGLKFGDRIISFELHGIFNEWEHMENTGCQYYQFYFSKVTGCSTKEQNYEGSRILDIKASNSDEEYHIRIIVDIGSDDSATIDFTFKRVEYTFYKYKGMSYKNVYYEAAYQARLEKRRQAYQESTYLETQYEDLGEGYAIKRDCYGENYEVVYQMLPHEKELILKGKGRKTIRIRECYLIHNEEVIFQYESISDFPCSEAAEIIPHQDGSKYFLFKTDDYGISVYNLGTKKVFYYIPEGNWHHYTQILGSSFIISEIHYDMQTNLIAYGGAYYSNGVCDVLVGDFSNPMNFNPVLKSMLFSMCETGECVGNDDVEFSAWKDGKLYLIINEEREKVVDIDIKSFQRNCETL